MTQLGVFPLLPGWDASASQGYPQQYIRRYPFIHLSEESTMRVKCLAQGHNPVPQPRLRPGPLDLEATAPPMLKSTGYYEITFLLLSIIYSGPLRKWQFT